MSNTAMKPWQRFLGLLELERKDIFQIAYFAIFEGGVSLSLPLGIQSIINLLQGAQVSTSWIVLVILVTLGVIFSGVLKYMQIRVVETIQQRIFVRASFELAYRFPKIKMKELNNYYLPEIANRFFDTLTIQKSLSKILLDMPSACLQILFALILLAFYHPFFIVFGLLLLVLILVVFRYTAERGLKTSIKESKHKYKVAHWLEEIARTVISFKLSGKTSLALDKSDSLVNDYINSRESHFKILVLQFQQMIGFKVIVTAGLLLVGGYLVLHQQMNIGQFVASEIIILLIMNSVEKLIMSLESVYDVLTSIEKLGEIVDKAIEEQTGETISDRLPFSVQLQDVTYRVPHRKLPVLHDISLEINQTDRVLIQGESGSGKSSLLQLISGLIEPSSGFVFVNNLSLQSVHLNHYRSKLGLLLSEETPFEGTIRDNVTFGDVTITDTQITEVFKSIGLVNFLKEQPKGLSTLLKPEGKQIGNLIAKKIILARAILKQPKLLILEDPLEQFNKEETQNIINYLCDMSHSWGIILVSENEAWASKCNKHVALQHGRLIINK